MTKNLHQNYELWWMKALSDRDAVVDKAPVLEKAPLEQDLFDHRLLYIEEDMVNRMLRAALRNHWFFLCCNI